MNQEQIEKVRSAPGFVAALDQSGGSTPSALKTYGVPPDAYHGDEEMFGVMHEMRSRIITSPSFGGDRILGAILFEDTMERQIDGVSSGAYLWNHKAVVPFLKIDKGLAEPSAGVQLMRPIEGLDRLLGRANENGFFGTKMRSVIRDADKAGIEALVAQQFETAGQVSRAGLMAIIEPEVDIHSLTKAKCEEELFAAISDRLDDLASGHLVMFKLTLPTVDDLYRPLTTHPNVLRVVALSGGYHRDEANALLARNHGIIASFSRALTEGLQVDQSPEKFDMTLDASIESIFRASTAKNS
ncbi:MAG: fructose bisphosphate aldolase [Acidimicrobiales bacterium]